MFVAKKRLLFIVLVLLVTAVACQAAPAEVPEVTFVGTEYAYEGPESIDGGWTQVTLDNQGEKPHDLLLIRLLDGKTAEDAMAILADEGAPPSWIDMVGGVSAGPGESKSFVSELESGDYFMFSFGSMDGEEPPDAAQGMVASLAVGEAKAAVDESALPEASGTIELVDYQFVIDGLKSGEQIVRMSNNGTELHEAIAFRLNEGATMADFMAFMEAEGSGTPLEGPPPVDGAPTALGFLSPGNVTYATVDLDPGNYVFLCFIPSEKNDNTPHVMLGMLTEVAVE